MDIAHDYNRKSVVRIDDSTITKNTSNVNVFKEQYKIDTKNMIII